MKKLILLLSMSLSLVAFAQQSNTNDILFTKNGEIIQGKVVKVTSSTINFSYPGETLINEIGAQNLEKIVFSSGRTQLFGATSSGNTDIAATKAVVPVPNSPTSQSIPKEEIYLGPDSYENNRLAVVPLSFTKNDTYDKDVSSQMTQFVTGYLLQKNQSLPIEVQDMQTTIKKLVDSGVGFQQLSQTPIDRLQQILGSEYIVVVEVGESSAKSQTKASSGFFDSAQVSTPSESGIRYDIELVIYGGQASEKYSAKFSDERSFKSPIANADQEGWKKAMQYVLDQVLSAGNL